MSTSKWLEVLKITEKIIRENAFEHTKNKHGLSANRPSNNWAQKCKHHVLRPLSRPRDHFEHHFFHSVCTDKWRAKQAVKELIPRTRVFFRVPGSRVNSPYAWLRQTSKFHQQASFVNKIFCICTFCAWVFFSTLLPWEFISVKLRLFLISKRGLVVKFACVT